MSTSWTKTSTDAAELQSALRPEDGTLTIATGGDFKATVVRIDLHRLWMQHSEETAGRSWQGVVPHERAGITYSGLNGTDFAIQGTAIGSTSIALLPAGEEFWQATSPHSQWGSLSLSVEDWHELIPTVAGTSVMPRIGERLAAPNPNALANLQRLHEAAVNLAKSTPELIANTHVARGLEQALILAVARCLRPPAGRETATTWIHHRAITQRFRDAIEQSDGEPIYLPELCNTLGVSVRTLQDHSSNFLGVSPKRYLLLRRMHLARKALRDANPEVSSVTEVATRFGFWELGRFSVAYRSLFGETPSRTLRAPSWL
jgi:AraC-like DNA-binding protein